MDSQTKIKNIIFFADGLDISQNIPAETNLESLNRIITEGNSTLVVDEHQLSKEYPLISVLGFAKTFSEGFKAQNQVQKGTARFFVTQSTVKKAQNDDEEVIEVKYISHPQKFSEISTDACVLVATDSAKMAEFCEAAEINYLHLDNISSYEEIRKAIEGNKSIDLLILHRKAEESNIAEVLNSIENLLKSNIFNYDAIKLIFSPFCQHLPAGQLIKKQEEQLAKSGQDVHDALAKVVPKQTWQFYRGKVALEGPETIVTTMLMINFRKELNRADTIRDVREYANVDSVGKFGGKVINSSGILRETLFELGKLPKFGA